VTQDAIVALTLIALLWIGWPLHTLASDIRVLRKLAERNK